MANFFRLILCVLLALGSMAVHAFAPSTVYSIGSLTGDSPSAVCQAYTGTLQPDANHDSYRFYSVEGLVCYTMAMRNGVDRSLMSTAITETIGCPQNSTTSGSGASASCSCNPGYFERTSSTGAKSCVKPDDRTPEQLCEDAALEYNSTLQADRFMRAKGPLSHYADGALTCADVNGLPEGQGCKHWFTGDLGFKDDQGQSWTNGHSIALNRGDSRAGGSLACSTADGGSPPKEDPPPDDCKQGYKGQVNGVDVCVEAWTGDTEGNDWERHTDGDGSKTDSKTNIKCKGDQCTVTETTTTTKPDGTSTTQTTTTENVNRQAYCARNPESSVCRREDDTSGGDKGPATRNPGGGGDGDGEGGFCKENPDSPMCKKSSFSGSCGANFQCDGDAIQCAIAKEQHIRACKLFDDKSPESDLYEAEKNKQGEQTKDLPGNREESMANRISTADAFGAGQCVQDLNIVVAGNAVTLPMSKICPIVSVLGNIMVGVALLLAVRIVGRG